MSEVTRYGRIGDMVLATKGLLELYPAMTVYVRASDYDAAKAELAALREDLAAMKYDCQVNNSVINAQKKDLADADQHHSEALELLAEISKAILRHQAEQPMSHRLAGLLTKARSKVDRYLKANNKPTESGASE